MKRRILIVVGLAIIAWLAYDMINAARMADQLNDARRAIQYFEAMHGQMTEDQRQGYLSNAYQACHYLEDNPDLPSLWQEMVDSGISSDAAATTIDAAIMFLCPDRELLDMHERTSRSPTPGGV